MKKFLLLLVIAAIGYGAYRYKDEILKMVNGDVDKETGQQNPTIPENPTTNSQPAKTSDPIAARYPMPVFKSIEELVGNWAEVPPSAFPRQITLNKKTKYVIAGGKGSSTAPAGSKAVAIALDAGQLLIMPRKGSTTRGRIPIDDTTFKAELTSAYNLYKQRKEGEVRKQRERAKTIAANSPKKTASSDSIQRQRKAAGPKLAEHEKKLGPMPVRAANGQVTLMVQSIRNRDISEIALDKISNWGPVRYELVENKPYWTGTVTYKTTSLFGTFDTEAMALMRNGKVIRWVYTGSLEEVP